jgi:hypothetical protein
MRFVSVDCAHRHQMSSRSSLVHAVYHFSCVSQIGNLFSTSTRIVHLWQSK